MILQTECSTRPQTRSLSIHVCFSSWAHALHTCSLSLLEFSGRDEPQVACARLWEVVQLHCPSDCFPCTRRHSPSFLMAEFHLCGSAQNVTLCRLNFSQGTHTYCKVYVQHSFLSLEVIENIKGTRHLYGFALRNKDLLLLQFVLQLWTFTHCLNLTLPSAKKRFNAQLVHIKNKLYSYGESFTATKIPLMSRKGIKIRLYTELHSKGTFES